MARDFTNERLAALGEVLEGRELRVSVRALRSPPLPEHLNADEIAADALAARWNACADALAKLDAWFCDDGNEPEEARTILRRAIYGEG